MLASVVRAVVLGALLPSQPSVLDASRDEVVPPPLEADIGADATHKGFSGWPAWPATSEESEEAADLERELRALADTEEDAQGEGSEQATDPSGSVKLVPAAESSRGAGGEELAMDVESSSRLEAAIKEAEALLQRVKTDRATDAPTAVPHRHVALPHRHVAFATLMYGNSRNGTLQIQVQGRSIRKQAPGVAHIVMMLDDVLEVTADLLRREGSLVLRVPTIPLPTSLYKVRLMETAVGRQMLTDTWRGIFSKVLISNFTDFEQVAFLDSDAVLISGYKSPYDVFDACGDAAICAVRDSMGWTPRGSPMLNAGLIVARPARQALSSIITELRAYEFHPDTKTPEQTFISDVFHASIKWLSPAYNFGCHHPTANQPFGFLTPRIGFAAWEEEPAIYHMCDRRQQHASPRTHTPTRARAPRTPLCPPLLECNREVRILYYSGVSLLSRSNCR